MQFTTKKGRFAVAFNNLQKNVIELKYRNKKYNSSINIQKEKNYERRKN